MKKSKLFIIVTILLVILFLLKTYIFLDFKYITIDEFKNKINNSNNNTVVYWGYYWEKEGYHYFMEKGVFDRYYYKIDNTYLEIYNIDHTFKKLNPLNLKDSNIKYLTIIEKSNEFNLSLKEQKDILECYNELNVWDNFEIFKKKCPYEFNKKTIQWKEINPEIRWYILTKYFKMTDRSLVNNKDEYVSLLFDENYILKEKKLINISN